MDPDSWSPIAKVYKPLMAGSIDTTDTEPHDRGIIRAMNAKYRPNKDVVGDPEKTVFIARLNPKTTEDTIELKFSKYGDIERLRLVRDIVTGHSRCYAFVEYASEKSAYRAHKEANKMELEGCEIFVDFECERTLKGWVPRRLGGGFGGKKESGQLRFGGKDRPFRKPLDFENRARSERFARERTRFRDGYRHEHSGRDRGRRDRNEDKSSDKEYIDKHTSDRDFSYDESERQSTRHKRSRSSSRQRFGGSRDRANKDRSVKSSYQREYNSSRK